MIKIITADITTLAVDAIVNAAEHGLKTIAFPCISTGVYGYPIRAAAEIALRETQAFLAAHPEMEVTFCCFSERDAEVYCRLKS